MKQQAVNTFSEGINFDLNPLTTPNNVLTDCVNGSFITFNGDELALQNDSGNTTIDYQGTPVQLSYGFYPLGIKEYGGVLYIISGKLPSTLASEILPFSPGTIYAPGVIIKYSSDATVFPYVFYKHTSTTSRAYSELPLETNRYWEVIGSEQDYNNYAGEVEIGSYPSPEASAIKDYIGDNYVLSSTETPLKLYKPKIINKELFKTGRYITFSEATTANIDSITHYVKTAGNFVKVPSFYKIRLLHQLSNGYVDLTDHVWSKYLIFLAAVTNGTTKYHWADTILQSGNPFKYYCASLYKGLLSMSLEIEDIDTFELNVLPAFKLNITDYDFTLKITAIPQSASSVTIPYVKIETWIDNIANPIEIQAVTTNLATYTLAAIPDTEANKLLSYRVTPILGYSTSYYAEDTVAITGPPTIESALPKEYIEKYTIAGSVLISTKLDNITFRREPSNTSDCVDGLKSNYEYYIVNTDGAYIDPATLEETTTKYVFVTSGETPTVGNTLKANYAISPVTKKPTLVSTVGIDAGIVTLFHNLTVVESCVYTIELTISFNMDLDEYSSISVTQNGVTDIYGYNISIPDEKILNIIPDIPVYIEIFKPGFVIASITGEVYTIAASESIALIADVQLENTGDLYRLWWNSSQPNLPTITNPNYSIYTSLHPVTPITASLEYVNVTEYATVFYPVEEYGAYISEEFTSGVPVADNVYYNITDDSCMEHEGIIFYKIIPS